jgi:hypothetical protein
MTERRTARGRFRRADFNSLACICGSFFGSVFHFRQLLDVAPRTVILDVQDA